jgi:hypothetical protein
MGELVHRLALHRAFEKCDKPGELLLFFAPVD